MEFKAGDVVQLKSGGPKMTVLEVDGLLTQAACVWFADESLIKKEEIALVLLTHAETKSQ